MEWSIRRRSSITGNGLPSRGQLTQTSSRSDSSWGRRRPRTAPRGPSLKCSVLAHPLVCATLGLAGESIHPSREYAVHKNRLYLGGLVSVVSLAIACAASSGGDNT